MLFLYLSIEAIFIPQVGKPIARTIDAVSACGNINLVHEDAATLEADYAQLHRLVDEGLFEVII